jgi:hypothetical protein
MSRMKDFMSEKYFLSRDNGFLGETFGNEWKLSASEASIAPPSGRTLVIPLARSSSATRALVASLGHRLATYGEGDSRSTLVDRSYRPSAPSNFARFRSNVPNGM